MHSSPTTTTGQCFARRLGAVTLTAAALTLALLAGVSSAHAATTVLTTPHGKVTVSKHTATTRLTRHNVDAITTTQHGRARTASVTDPQSFANLPTTTVYSDPWYEGGGSCTTSGAAVWTRASNLLAINGSAHTSAPFFACRANLVVTYWASYYGFTFPIGSTTATIPTACAILDPSCPSTQPLNVVIPNSLPGTVYGVPLTSLVDHITLAATAA